MTKGTRELTTTKNVKNVTIGTLEDAQKESGNREKGRGTNGKGSSKECYIYCDFGQIEEEEYDVAYEIDQEGLFQALDESTTMAAAQSVQHQSISYLQQPPPVLRASGWVRSQRFPIKLYALLSQPQLSSIITWMPHGRSWKVLKPRVFETSVLPVFFESDNYHSFNRVINAWSFRRKSTGPDRGSYFHELFLRGKPHLQKFMRRLPRTHKKLAMAKSEEPDFFELAKTSPLPTLEQARAHSESRKLLRIRDELEKGTSSEGGELDGKKTDDNGQEKNHKTEQPIQNEVMQKSQLGIRNIDQYALGIHRNMNVPSNFTVPDALFQFKSPDDQFIKNQLRLHARVSLPQQSQAEAALFRQQGQQLLARHHRAQMLHQLEQEQYLRSQGIHQSDLTHQHHNPMNLFRQMEYLQQQKRHGF